MLIRMRGDDDRINTTNAYIHTACFLHGICNTIKGIVKEISFASTIYDKCRLISRKSRKNGAFAEQLKEYKFNAIPNPIETRWGASLDLLIYFKDRDNKKTIATLNSLIQSSTNLSDSITDNDLIVKNQLCDLLSPFKIIIETM